jgi:hypothetical protein
MFTEEVRPKKDREWRAITGLDKERFMKLSTYFDQAFRMIRGGDIQQTHSPSSNPDKYVFKTNSDLLFFILVSLKSGITYDFLAFFYQTSQSNAKRNHTLGLKVLNLALDQADCLPLRSFDTVEEFHQYFEVGTVLTIDATEQLIQRPEDREGQRETYSGKKKANTHKVMIISTLDRVIHYASVVYTGRTYDFSLLKEEFPPEEPWFDPYAVRIDLGYQGFTKDYPNAQVYIPHKKPRKSELTQDQKDENKELARQRISVEHSIGGMKRYDILSGKSRFHDLSVINLVIENCAGLWNFYLSAS